MFRHFQETSARFYGCHRQHNDKIFEEFWLLELERGNKQIERSGKRIVSCKDLIISFLLESILCSSFLSNAALWGRSCIKVDLFVGTARIIQITVSHFITFNGFYSKSFSMRQDFYSVTSHCLQAKSFA